MNVRLTKEEKIKIANTDDVFEIMRKVLMREKRLARLNEHFWVIGLDVSQKIQLIELVALGRQNCVHVEPLDVFHPAAAKKLPSIIVVHNHPSGTLKPSKDDKALTKQLVEGGKLLGITLLDHFIITEEAYTSFKIEGLL